MFRRILLGASLCLGTVSLFGHTAIAQSIEATAPGVSETALVFETTAGSDVWGLDFDPDCIGYFSQSPTLLLSVVEVQNLAIFVAGEFDTAMMVQAPDGSFGCNDDEFGVSNSAVALTDAAAGEYKVWAGAFEPQDNLSVTLGVAAEFPQSADALSDSDFDTAFNANFEISLVGGDNPLSTGGPSSSALETMLANQADSRLAFTMTNAQRGVSGDAYITDEQSLAELNPSCTGYGDLANPLIVTAAFESPDELVFFADSGTDLTMMVIAPDGETLCSDDFADSRNPLVSFPATQAGGYQVFVAGYSSAVGETVQLSAGPTPAFANPNSTPELIEAFQTAFGTTDLDTGGAGMLSGSSEDNGPMAGPIDYLMPNDTALIFDLVEGVTDLQIVVESRAPLNLFGDACPGNSGQAPSLVFTVTPEQVFEPITVGMTADLDGVMAIAGPDGDVTCNDDGPSGLNPELTWTLSSPGQYKVWFGGYDSNDNFPAIAALRFGANSQPTVLDLETPPASDPILIVEGVNQSVTASVDGDMAMASMATTVSNCPGTVGTVAIADLVLESEINSPVQMATNASFLMQTPDGAWICPAENQLAFSNLPGGTYRLWSSEAELKIDISF